MDEITKKWLEFGFLEGIEDQYHRDMLVSKYEQAMSYATNQYSDTFIIYPVIYRIFRVYINFDVGHLVQHFTEWYTINHERIEIAKKQSYNAMDVEAEETCNYCESYIHEFKNYIKPLNHIKKHKL